MVRLADPATPLTKWWVVCDRKAALDQVRAVVAWHPSWFREHGLQAEYGTMDGDSFTPDEVLDTSGIQV